MPAPYTPVHVSATDVIRAAEQEVENSQVSSRCGPWAYGGNLYIVGQTGYGTLSGQLVVYRSTDGGATWAEVDPGNGPQTQYSDAAGDHFRTFNVARSGVDRSGTVLYVGYAAPFVPGDALVAFCSFDLTTETWGVPHVSAFSTEPTAGTGNAPSFRVEYRAVTNDLVITNWESDGMGIRTHKVYTASLAGVWAYLGNLSQTDYLYDTVSCVSHSGADEWVHFLWVEHDLVTNIGTVTHQSLDKTNALSAPQSILALTYNGCPAGWQGTTTPGPPVQQLDSTMSYGEPFADGLDILFPLMTRNYYHGTGGVPTAITDLACVGLAFHGTPGANPIWTVGEFYRGTGRAAGPLILPAYYFNGMSAFRNPLDGKLYIIRNTRSVTGPDVHDQLIQVENTVGTTWGNDTVLFTQTDADYQNGLQILNNPFLAGDATNAVGWNLRFSYGVVGFLQNNDDVLNYWAISFPASNPLAIICDNPPSGQVGAPYTHTFPASGGTPPYTFSIFAGILPPGLSLDPSTGQVSGIPTAGGVYPFIIQVASS